jgi:DUF971 family protein
MHYGDIINMVDIGHNTGLTDAQQCQELTTGQGRDFIFNESKRLLKVRVRFGRFLAQADIVQAQLRVLSPLPNLIANEEYQNTVFPGTVFVRHGVHVKVISVDQQNVVICYDDGQHTSIIINEAIELIDEYID